MLDYFLQTTILWMGMYLFYVLFLEKETFHKTNRYYLLTTLLAGLLVPLLPTFSLKDTDALGLTMFSPIAVGRSQLGEILHTTVAQQQYGWQYYAFIGYIIGVAVALGRLLWGLFQLLKLIWRYEHDHVDPAYTLIKIPASGVPFSFFHWLFWYEKTGDNPQDRNLILEHELAHIRQFHSVDVMFLTILGVFFWWNPLIYRYKNKLRTLHELLADEAVLRQTNVQYYGHLLIRQAQSGPALVLANHFFSSQLKQRIKMMTQSKSNPVQQWKYSLALPLLLTFAACLHVAEDFAQGTSGYYLDAKMPDETSLDTVITFDPTTYEETVRVSKNAIAAHPDQSPRYIGGVLACEDLSLAERDICAQRLFRDALLSKLVLPNEVRSGKVHGQVIIKAYIYANGDLFVMETPFKSLNRACDQAAVNALRALPNEWAPGRKNGQKVNTVVLIPIDF